MPSLCLLLLFPAGSMWPSAPAWDSTCWLWVDCYTVQTCWLWDCQWGLRHWLLVLIVWFTNLNIDWGLLSSAIFVSCNVLWACVNGGNSHRYTKATDSLLHSSYGRQIACRKCCATRLWNSLGSWLPGLSCQCSLLSLRVGFRITHLVHLTWKYGFMTVGCQEKYF